MRAGLFEDIYGVSLKPLKKELFFFFSVPPKEGVTALSLTKWVSFRQPARGLPDTDQAGSVRLVGAWQLPCWSKREMGVAQNSGARVMQVVAFGSICQGAMWVIKFY